MKLAEGLVEGELRVGVAEGGENGVELIEERGGGGDAVLAELEGGALDGEGGAGGRVLGGSVAEHFAGALIFGIGELGIAGGFGGLGKIMTGAGFVDAIAGLCVEDNGFAGGIFSNVPAGLRFGAHGHIAIEEGAIFGRMLRGPELVEAVEDVAP
jgi:hypothetical protein